MNDILPSNVVAIKMKTASLYEMLLWLLRVPSILVMPSLACGWCYISVALYFVSLLCSIILPNWFEIIFIFICLPLSLFTMLLILCIRFTLVHICDY